MHFRKASIQSPRDLGNLFALGDLHGGNQHENKSIHYGC